MVVTPSYFRVLGLRPILGREFTDAELGRPNVPPIGDHPRLRPLAAQVQRRSEHRRPDDSHEPHAGAAAGRRRDAAGHQVPARSGRVERAQLRPQRARRFLVRHGAGRVAPGRRRRATPSRGCATARRVAAGAGRDHGAVGAGWRRPTRRSQGITAAVVPVQDVLNRDGRRLLVPLFGSVALVFFIACANVAGLLLTRGLQRQPEYAMRSALGAGRWRLFRQALTESLVLALAGAALGAGARRPASSRCSRRLPGRRCRAPMPSTSAGRSSPSVCSPRSSRPVIAGLLPAARASLPDRFQGLKGSAHDRRRGRAPAARRRRDAADRPHRRAPVGRGAPRPHGAQPRSHAARLRHREHPGDDGHDDGPPEVDRVPQARARARGRGAGRDARGVRVGRAADRQQVAWRHRVSRAGRARRSWPIASPCRCVRSPRTTSTSWA